MDWLINHTPYLISCTTNQTYSPSSIQFLGRMLYHGCVSSLFSCSQVVSVESHTLEAPKLHLVIMPLNSQMLSWPFHTSLGHKKHFHVAQQKWEVTLSISGCLSKPFLFFSLHSFDFAKIVNVLLNKHILHWNKQFIFFLLIFFSNKIWKVTKIATHCLELVRIIFYNEDPFVRLEHQSKNGSKC